ncbi:hypothetical protein LMH73_007505 [Vibrio splendidus]|nr:hypothetical protein [Vibrio splendidus]MCC4880375.1 hypothetical protein [Vibrio splendidus]
MNKITIGIITLAILSGVTAGSVALGYKFNPDFLNDVHKLKVSTVEQAYLAKKDALKFEREMYSHYDGEFIPLYYKNVKSISRLDELDPLLFKTINKEEVASALKEGMEVYPPKPFIIEKDGELKNVCFIHATDFRDLGEGSSYYAASKCRIGFEEFKVMFSKIMPIEDVMSYTTAYIRDYNQKTTPEELADQTIYRYYFNTLAGVDASMQAMRKEVGLPAINRYIESKRHFVSDPYYLIYDFDRPFVRQVIKEAQAGNISLEVDSFSAFTYVFNSLKQSMPHQDLIRLMVNQYEIEQRSNTARRGITEGDTFLEFIDIK